MTFAGTIKGRILSGVRAERRVSKREHWLSVAVLAANYAAGRPLFPNDEVPVDEDRHWHVLDPGVRRRIVAMRRERGPDGRSKWRYRDIAERLGVNRTAVATTCRAAGLGNDVRPLTGIVELRDKEGAA